MQLNREIIQAPTAAELLALCQLRITELNAVNVATALNQLAKRRDARDAWHTGKMSLLIDAAESFAKTGSGRELASMAWSCAKVEFCHRPLLEAIARCAQQQSFAPQGLSNLSWAFATVKFLDAPLMFFLAFQVVEQISEFDAQCVANTAWAYACLKITDQRLMEAVGEYVVNRTATFAPQGLANRAQTPGTLGIRRKPLLDAIAEAAVNCSGFTS